MQMNTERIIKSVEDAFDVVKSEYEGTSFFNEAEWKQNKQAALDLLKERTALKPYVDSEGTCMCDSCGETVGWYPVGCNTPVKFCKYCPECGRRVDWD